MTEILNVHGTALLLGETGVLLRGPSGAGKSLLALALLERWQDRGITAYLVADDRVDLRAGPQSIVMSAPKNIIGLIELRGRGIIKRPQRDGVTLELVIDLVPELERMPEDAAMRVELAGHELARAPVPVAGVIGLGHQLLLVAEAIAALRNKVVTPRKITT